MENILDLLLLIFALFVFGLALEHATTGVKNLNVLGLHLKQWGLQLALLISVGVALSYNIDLTKYLPPDLLPSLPPEVAETVSGLVVAWISSWIHDNWRTKEPKPVEILPALFTKKS